MAGIIVGEHENLLVSDLFTADEPLGPVQSDGIVSYSAKAFGKIYVPIERTADDYVVGRKGAGKTSFIVGNGLEQNAAVFHIESSDIYTEFNGFQVALDGALKPSVADFAALWRTVLEHIAIYGVCQLPRMGRGSPELSNLRMYLSGIRPIQELSTGVIVASVVDAVAQNVNKRYAGDPGYKGRSFVELCEQVSNGMGRFEEASQWLRDFLKTQKQKLHVVVDNLEDLDPSDAATAKTLKGLFKCVSDDRRLGTNALPFRCQFAFPAELFAQLNRISSNVSKDFPSVHQIVWSKKDLWLIAAERLHLFSPASVSEIDPQVDPRDYLRQFLPKSLSNGLGMEEDPSTYILRHTQLLPRQFLSMLNHVLSPAAHRSGRLLGTATVEEVLAGVRNAEKLMIQAVFDAFGPAIAADTIETFGFDLSEMMIEIRNNVGLVMPMSEWRIQYNRNVSKDEDGFKRFIRALLKIGAVGVYDDVRSQGHYSVAEFQYEQGEDLSPVEGEDSLCVHPLFMSKFFDDRRIRQLRDDGARPVMPSGVVTDVE